jgi:hypothetical protein
MELKELFSNNCVKENGGKTPWCMGTSHSFKFPEEYKLHLSDEH